MLVSQRFLSGWGKLLTWGDRINGSPREMGLNRMYIKEPQQMYICKAKDKIK